MLRRAGSHHVAGLLALVADAVLFTWAFTGQVANLTAVVALLTLSAVTRQVTVATARVASLLTTTGTTTTTVATTAGSTTVTTTNTTTTTTTTV